MTLDAETSAAYYEALQLPQGSSAAQIHAQYRFLAKRYHPDRNPHRREWSEEHLRRLNEAYHALSEASHALADADAVPPLSAAPAPPASSPPSADAGPEPILRPRLGRRVLRYLAVVGLVCGVSVAYSTWSQSLPLSPVPVPSAAAPVPPPAAPAPPPAEGEQAALTAKFSAESIGVNDLVARASLIVTHVNAELQHAPGSRRPQKSELLAADVLELSRLQQSVRTGLEDLGTPTTPDLHRAQVADLQLALFQLARQQHLVNAETASFPTR